MCYCPLAETCSVLQLQPGSEAVVVLLRIRHKSLPCYKRWYQTAQWSGSAGWCCLLQRTEDEMTLGHRLPWPFEHHQALSSLSETNRHDRWSLEESGHSCYIAHTALELFVFCCLIKICPGYCVRSDWKSVSSKEQAFEKVQKRVSFSSVLNRLALNAQEAHPKLSIFTATSNMFAQMVGAKWRLTPTLHFFLGWLKATFGLKIC